MRSASGCRIVDGGGQPVFGGHPHPGRAGSTDSVGVVALLDHDGSYSPLAVEYLDGAAVATLMRFAVEDARETENSLRGCVWRN